MSTFLCLGMKPRRPLVRPGSAATASSFEAGASRAGTGRARAGRRAKVVASAWLLAIVGWLAGSSRALAGGGPENLLLVVNSASWASQAVANQYIHLRRVPPENVCYLDWDGGFAETDIATFRRQILVPVLAKMRQRGLDGQIDYIVYSSDFPTAITANIEFQSAQFPNQLYPTASINSATYLLDFVLAKNAALVGLTNNGYMRIAPKGAPLPPVHGFRSWYGWGPEGQLLEAGGQHYYLSTVLAVTSGRGNSTGEATGSLTRSAGADGTHPSGTIYYMQNNDVRSTMRDAGFPAAVAALKELGVRAVIESGTVPNKRPNVQGLMTGTREIHWAQSGSTISSGALCENFTSFAGVMTEGNPQTPLSEFLRYGAAGATGTVAEPYSIWQKASAPAVQVYYASGCTLAESLYQSVSGPYQLLIVGDPLCRPWANIPQVSCGDVRADSTLHGVVEIRPSATFAKDVDKLPGGDPSNRVGRYELFVDGRRTAFAAPADRLTLDTRHLIDGFHELRIVAIAAGAIETQGRAIVTVQVDNHGRTIDFTATAVDQTTTPAGQSKTAHRVHWDEPLLLAAKSSGMAEIVFAHNGRVLGRSDSDDAQVKINPRILGTGPVTLQAFGREQGETALGVQSRPIELTIEANRPLPAWRLPRGVTLVRGMELRLAGGKTVPIQETLAPTWLADAGVKPGEAMELEGVFDAPTTETYQFQLWHDGDLKLTVDDSVLYDGTAGTDRERIVPVALAEGLHRLKLVGQAGPKVQLKVLFGGRGTLSLDGLRFRHTKK
ncbi:MAG TPA: hypothetical protein VHY91_06880 [Pirellulales bacterium]|jgi:hypothetical protein|nr:hypothetical protein [Pirellulales bacterium]